MTKSSFLFASAVLALASCDSKPQGEASAPVAKTEAPAPVVAEAPKQEAAAKAEQPVAQDFGDFGSDEPLPRADQPKRGVLRFEPKDGTFTPMDHWEQYDWVFTPKRPGHYRVRLNYELDHATLGLQLKMGEVRLRKVVPAAQAGHVVTLGDLEILTAEKTGFSIYAPQSANSAGFGIKSVELVPIAEGAPVLKPAADGSITALAKEAVTWSETMRYEDAKNCLGYWTDAEDFAEWELVVDKPGSYEILVTHGCGDGNAGSEVAVRVAGQEAKFTVQDTGGFQSWKELSVGKIEIKAPGTQFLVIDPLTKTKAAVLDVQKIVLRPIQGA
jgi:hypothetical protein